MKSAVVYYSLSGKTELAARAIAGTINAVIKRIEETESRKGIMGFLRGGRDAMKGKCSELKPLDFNIDDYDLIFLGTPVWAFKPAPAMNTFVSRTDFHNKKVVIFVTMGGSGDQKTIKILTEAVTSRGGSVINASAIRTGGGVKDAEITEKGKAIGRQLSISQAQP